VQTVDDRAAATERRHHVVAGRLGLRWTLLAWFVLLASALIVASTVVSVRLTARELGDRVDEELRLAAQRLEQQAATLPADGGRVGFESMLERLVAVELHAPEVGVAALVGDDVVATGGSSGLAAAMEPGGTIDASELVERSGYRTGAAEGASVRVLVVPIEGGDQDGTLVIARSLEGVTSSTDAVMRSLVIVGALLLLAFGLLAWGTISRSLRPIRQLARTARHIGDDSLDERFVVEGRDEVAHLAQTFNDMLDRLASGIHARDLYAAHLDHAVTHDSLTRSKNRVAFYRALERVAEPAHGDLHAVFVIDLDGFKQVNDTYGHQAGDAVLVEVARRINVLVRPRDTFARLGGDEFALLCEGLAGPEEADRIARRIRIALSRPILHRGLELQVGASIGCAVCVRREDAPSLLPLADAAMYRAKRSGVGIARWADDVAAVGTTVGWTSMLEVSANRRSN
jgi:diguanylate cyclase (GGDEF)-like protein